MPSAVFVPNFGTYPTSYHFYDMKNACMVYSTCHCAYLETKIEVTISLSRFLSVILMLRITLTCIEANNGREGLT